MTKGVGRERDPDIDKRILAAARRQLSAHGYEAMSVAAVADEAGTTRQALYRRWPRKADLAAAVVTEMTDRAAGAQSASPFDDLVAELTNFQRGVSRTGRLSLVGTMLQDTTDPTVRSRYRADVVAPRRARLRAILERGVLDGQLDPDADLEVALTMCTGSWYGRALAGSPPPKDWPLRCAGLVWRSLGGAVPLSP